ncbi:hypothetical protein EGW08_005582, partial [Elysia chlorotica]
LECNLGVPFSHLPQQGISDVNKEKRIQSSFNQQHNFQSLQTFPMIPPPSIPPSLAIFIQDSLLANRINQASKPLINTPHRIDHPFPTVQDSHKSVDMLHVNALNPLSLTPPPHAMLYPFPKPPLSSPTSPGCLTSPSSVNSAGSDRSTGNIFHDYNMKSNSAYSNFKANIPRTFFKPESMHYPNSRINTTNAMVYTDISKSNDLVARKSGQSEATIDAEQSFPKEPTAPSM